MNDEPRQKLRELIVEYGRSLCNDPSRCEALLKDYCGVHKREIFVLVSALRKKVTDDMLMSSASVPQELLMARLRKRLEDELAMTDEAAHWAVESWALALGFISFPSSSVKVAAQPKRPPVAANSVPVVSPAHSTEVLMAGRYRDNYDGTVTDITTGLQWMRFSLGQDWKDATCLGEASLYKSQEAVRAAELLNSKRGYAGHSDWKVPTKEDLLSLIYLSSGKIETWGVSGNRPPANFDAPTIHQEAFPRTPLRRYWSCTSYAAGTNSTWLVDFNNGSFSGSGRGTDCALRLTRAIR